MKRCKKIEFENQNEELVCIDLDNKGKLFGILHSPIRKVPKQPSLIFCGGLNAERSDVNRIAVKAARTVAKFLPVFRFDYRGLGLSSGETWEMGITSKIQDIEEIIQYLEASHACSEFILLGFSDGGKNVLDIAVRQPKVKGIILWNPTMVQSRETAIKQKPIFDQKLNLFLWRLKGIYLASSYYREVAEYEKKFEEQINRLTIPTLIVWGGNDPNVLDTRMFISKLGEKSNFKEIEVPGATHLFSKTQWVDELLGHTISWLKGEYLTHD